MGGWLSKSWCFDRNKFCTAAEKNQTNLCIFLETCPKYVKRKKKTSKIVYSITSFVKIFAYNIFLNVYNSFGRIYIQGRVNSAYCENRTRGVLVREEGCFNFMPIYTLLVLFIMN